MCQGVDLESSTGSQGLVPVLAQGSSCAAPIAEIVKAGRWMLGVAKDTCAYMHACSPSQFWGALPPPAPERVKQIGEIIVQSYLI